MGRRPRLPFLVGRSDDKSSVCVSSRNDDLSTSSTDSPVPELYEREEYDSSVSSDHSCDGSIDSETIESSIRSCPETDEEDTLDDSGVECRTRHNECPPSAETDGTQNKVATDQWGNDIDRNELRTRLRDKIRNARHRLSR